MSLKKFRRPALLDKIEAELEKIENKEQETVKIIKKASKKK